MVDNETMALIAKGNIGAFEQLYRGTYRQVFAYIAAITNDRYIAQDLLHDTYVRIYEKASYVRGRTNVRGWMMTIARNIAIDYLRAEKKTVSLDVSSTTDGNPEYRYHSSTDPIESLTLEAALRKLSDLNTEIIVLYGICGFKHREISQILGIPEGTIRRRYGEAREELKAIMR